MARIAAILVLLALIAAGVVYWIGTGALGERWEEGTPSDTRRSTSAVAAGAAVHEMVAIGGTPDANALSLKLAEAHPGRIFGCAGYDRDEATHGNDLSVLRDLVADPLVKAVGETGLDYYYTAETASEQKALFNENLALAIEFEKPVVVHSRDADEDTAAILKEESRAGDFPGVLHCFSAGRGLAEAAIELFRTAAPVDYERLRNDLDRLADPDATPRA